MSTASESFTIKIEGGPPFGFRLIQKLMDNSLVISKLRINSKAEESGLKEGDILCQVNGQPCDGFNCTQALNLIEAASSPLYLEVRRKGNWAKSGETNLTYIKKPLFASNNLNRSNQIQQQQQSNIIQNSKEIGSKPKKIYVGSTYQLENETAVVPIRKISITEASSKVIRIPEFITNSLYKVDNKEYSSKMLILSESPAKKKTFMDSAFYNNPLHKYPTLEEQVQLARKVALSVMIPANANSKGHKMFVRAKERVKKYTTGAQDDDQENENGNQDELRSMMSGVPKSVVFAPKLPTNKTVDQLNAMSSEELERMRLSERKTTHTNVSPQVCFNLADDLKNMKGKGGRLFAKRQAKSEKWIVGEGDTVKETNNEIPEINEHEEKYEIENHNKVMAKLRQTHKTEQAVRKLSTESPSSQLDSYNLRNSLMPVNRLSSIIASTQSAITPWDAAVQYGNVDKAFEHLKTSQEGNGERHGRATSLIITGKANFSSHSTGGTKVNYDAIKNVSADIPKPKGLRHFKINT